MESTEEETRFPPPTLDEVKVTIESCVFLDTIGPLPPLIPSSFPRPVDCKGRRLLFAVAPAHANLFRAYDERRSKEGEEESRKENVDVAALAAVVFLL